MTDKSPPAQQRHSDALQAELNKMKNAPILQRGEAALRLAAMTVAAMRHLETRIATLEGRINE